MPLFFNVPVRGGTPGKILVLKRNVSRLPALLQLGLHFISHSWECPGTLCSLNLKVESVIILQGPKKGPSRRTFFFGTMRF